MSFFNLVMMSWHIFMHNITDDLCELQPWWRHLHISQHGVVAGDRGEVTFQNGDGAGQSHVAAPAEQGDAGEAEDCSHQRRVGHPA